MIIDKASRLFSKIEIDLTGPDGNAYCLMGYAKSLSKALELDYTLILNKMMDSDYEHLLSVFEEYFGDYVIMY